MKINIGKITSDIGEIVISIGEITSIRGIIDIAIGETGINSL